MHTVFIGGLREWHRREHVESLLAVHGLPFAQITVPLDRLGNGLLIAFVECATRAEADAIILQLHELQYCGGSLIATPQAPRRRPSSQYRHPPRRANL